MQALAQPPMARRAALRGVALGLGGCAATWLAWQASPGEALGASYHTATGERQQLGLPDGSELALDTATAVDEHFDANDRRLSLRSGRIQITTRPTCTNAPSACKRHRAAMLALGIQFTRAGAGRPAHPRGGARKIGARAAHPWRGAPAGGRAADGFFVHRSPAPQPAHLAQASWRDGGLIALDMPLAELVQELARYRPAIWAARPKWPTCRCLALYAGQHRPSAGRPGRQLCRAGAPPHALLQVRVEAA